LVALGSGARLERIRAGLAGCEPAAERLEVVHQPVALLPAPTARISIEKVVVPVCECGFAQMSTSYRAKLACE
jgi:hypothetical protein